MDQASWKQKLHFSLSANLKHYTMMVALLSICFIFGYLTDGVFLSTRNLSNLFVQTATTAILAIGMVLIIVPGHIDLSVGSTMGFCGALAVWSMIRFEVSTPVSILITLGAGVAIGLWHGYWVAYRRVPAFIVTLASMLAFRGAIIGLTEGQTLGLEMTPDPDSADSFAAIGQNYLPSFTPHEAEMGWHDGTVLLAVICIGLLLFNQWRKRHRRIKQELQVSSLALEVLKSVSIVAALGAFFGIMARYLGIPYSIILVLVLAWILNTVMNQSVFGRHLYAIGGNPEAARFSGINTQQRILLAFTVMGFLVAVAGLVSTARLNAATTSAGQNAELDAIASAVIGGTSLMGGQGTIWGAIIGALVMSSLDNGMSLMNMDITFQYLIKGAILLTAVWIDMMGRKAQA